MSAFNEHFLDKYFGYRVRYVEAVRERAPHRAPWAIAAELARLSFVIGASALCMLILGALTVGALERVGLQPWPVIFGLLTLMSASLGLLAVRGLVAATGAWRAERLVK